MSPSEIAILALGLAFGSTIGAALVEIVRRRPARRREVRVTISPNSIAPRRAVTLASQEHDDGGRPAAGSFGDEAWPNPIAGGPPGETPTTSEPTASPTPTRTRVPSAPVTVPASAIAVQVGDGPAVAGIAPSRQANRAAPDAGAVPMATAAVGVVDAPSLATADGGTVMTTGSGWPTFHPAGDPRPSEAGREDSPPAAREDVPVTAQVAAPVVARVEAPAAARTEARVEAPVQAPGSTPVQAPGSTPVQAPGSAPVQAPASGWSPATGWPPAKGTPARTPVVPGAAGERGRFEACRTERLLVDERSAIAEAERDRAHRAADTLREARHAYDLLRERADRAREAADPREIAAATDALHDEFRAARAAAATPSAVEAAARDWFDRVNRLKAAADEAQRVAEVSGAELRAALPRLEQLAVEADAARIAAESAEAALLEAREILSNCEQRAGVAMGGTLVAVPMGPVVAPTAAEQPRIDAGPSPGRVAATTMAVPAGIARRNGEMIIVRILRGDGQARARLVAALADGDPGAARTWQLRIADLVDAIVARALEDGWVDPPGDGFWGQFSPAERRDVVTALAALGFRYDGLGGFVDGFVPSQYDLSLAVGYGGLDQVRVRTWPRGTELRDLYSGAVVAADEWLAHKATDLSVARITEALGERSAGLADVWNAWTRIRPILIEVG